MLTEGVLEMCYTPLIFYRDQIEQRFVLNWRRGFNRVFVVLAVGWTVFVLLIIPIMDRQNAFQDYKESLQRCATTEVPSRVIDPNYSRCAEGAEVFLKFRLERYSLHAWLNWRSLLFRLGVLLLPPVAAYGLFRLGWFAFAWIRRGFRQPAS
jgi:hypothetical protein